MQPPQGGFGYQQPPQQQQPTQQPAQQPVQQQYQQPVQQFQHPVSQYQQQPNIVHISSGDPSDKPNLALAWIGVLVIFGGLAAPWIDIGFFEVSGYEVLDIMAELIDDVESPNDDSSDDGGSGDDPDKDEIFFGLAVLLFAIGPLIYLLSAIISALILLTGNSPRVIGALHIAYAVALLILGFTASIGIGFNVSDVYGFGVYLCSGAGFLLYQK